jgi:hypothetical protein
MIFLKDFPVIIKYSNQQNNITYYILYPLLNHSIYLHCYGGKISLNKID